MGDPSSAIVRRNFVAKGI